MNIDKSHFVIFHRARLKQNIVNISLCDISLNRVTFTKLLGVIIDVKLSFSRNVSYIKNKISKRIGIIVKARKYLNKKLLLYLYHAFVYPYMSNVHLDALDKILKNILQEVIRELFITNDTFHSHNTRNKNKLRSKMSNRGYTYKNFSFIGVYIWNDIQDHIVINTSSLKFVHFMLVTCIML